MLKSVKLPRLASLLLAALTVVSILTPWVYAAGGVSEIPSVDYRFVYVNPRYLDKYAGAFQNPPLFIDFAETSQELLYSSASSDQIYEDIADAADYLRECFAQRQEKIILYMKTEYGLDSDVNLIASVIEAHTGNPKYGDAIALQYSTFQYGFRYDRRKKSYYYAFEVSYYTTLEQEVELDRKLDRVFEDMELEGVSDYRKVRRIYDYIASNVSYDKTSSGFLKYTAYGALCEGKSVCQGYAVLFYRMCLQQGIDARVITGVANGEAHAWNIVQIDGKYYLCDPTWDSPISYYHDYFLKSEKGFPKHTAASAFLTDEFKALYPISDSNLLDHSDNINWNVSNGVLTINSDYDLAFRDDDSAAPWSSRVNEIRKVVIGGDVRVLGSRSFEGMTNLTEVVFHERTRDIGYWCFAWCTKLKSLTMPNYVENIGKYAFYNCTSLSEIKLSPKLKIIDDGAFYNCTSLKSVVLPNGIKKIGANAFACPIDTITIPRSIDSPSCIASNAFTYKGRLTVRCYKDSYAVEYCKKYNIKYVIIDDIIGDLNGNGAFDDEDLEMLLDGITGIAPLDKSLLDVADVNCDGVIDIKDFNILYSQIHQN